MKSPHATTELRVMYQALQVHKERNSGEGEAGWSSGQRAIGHHYALCVCVSEQSETGICDIPTYWND